MVFNELQNYDLVKQHDREIAALQLAFDKQKKEMTLLRGAQRATAESDPTYGYHLHVQMVLLESRQTALGLERGLAVTLGSGGRYTVTQPGSTYSASGASLLEALVGLMGDDDYMRAPVPAADAARPNA